VLGHDSVRSDHDWPASSRNDASSTKDGRPSTVGAVGRGDVMLKTCKGGAASQARRRIVHLAVIRPDGGDRRHQGG
jgi:hypothetical protein